MPYAGVTVKQAISFVLGAFSTAEVRLVSPPESAHLVVLDSRVLQLTDDFGLSMMLGFGKGASFTELRPPPDNLLQWLHHFLCVGEYGEFLLMSISTCTTTSRKQEIVQARFMQPADQFLNALFTNLTDLRLTCLQRLGAIVNQQVSRYEKRLAALREAHTKLQGVLAKSSG